MDNIQSIDGKKKTNAGQYIDLRKTGKGGLRRKTSVIWL
jgi:hypothetical protein